MLERATRRIPADCLGSVGTMLNDLYLLVNNVDGLRPGAYVFHRERSVLELVGLLGVVLGRKLPVAREPQRDGEAFRITPSVEKARRLLGFEARVSLPEGLAATCDWFQRSTRLRLAA